MPEQLYKITKHPDREEIIKMLLNGDSVKSIDAWLKTRYPKPQEKKFHISYMSLQKFRSEELNLKSNILEDIKKKKKTDELASADEEMKSVALNSTAYQAKLNEIVSQEMDVSRRLLEMEKLISARMEFYYNQLAAGTHIKGGDEVFLGYINAMRSIMQDWKKYVEGFADKKVEHNVNISVVDDQLKIMKEVVVDVLRDMDPNLVLIFMERINRKMSLLKHGTPEYDKYLEVIDVESI